MQILASMELAEPRFMNAERGVAPIQRVKCPLCKQKVAQDRMAQHQCAAVKEVCEDFMLMYQCDRCGDVFTGMSNMGNWQCMMHPGKFTPEGYTCCGRKRFEPTNPAVHNMVWKRRGIVCPLPFDPPPCTPCDHVSRKMPASTNALRSLVDVQRDLPDQVFASMVPTATDRPGFQVVKGADGANVGVLNGRDKSKAEREGRSLLW